MSILIKGQELPISCGDCMKLFLTKGRNKCPFLWKCFGDNDEYQNKKRMPDCPLVEVPTPHGRLIDEDMLNESLNAHRAAIGDGNVADAIDETPTVIEAEE